MKKYQLALAILSVTALTTPQFALAQKTGDDELDVVELELEKPLQAKKTAERTNVNNDAKSDAPVTDFSGLSRLSPFSEVSIIQKRYLPKTERFQAFLGPTIVTNDPFFTTLGAQAKIGYFLSETWGVELNYFSLSTSEKEATKELKAINGVNTVNLVYPKSYVGLDLVYVPVYGKMSYFNRKIVPFDLYISAGYGTTSTQSGESAGTVHLAAGQIFAITKAFAFRWDFSWNLYNARAIDGSQGSVNNLFLTVGASFFFPEAKYR